MTKVDDIGTVESARLDVLIQTIEVDANRAAAAVSAAVSAAAAGSGGVVRGVHSNLLHGYS